MEEVWVDTTGFRMEEVHKTLRENLGGIDKTRSTSTVWNIKREIVNV